MLNKIIENENLIFLFFLQHIIAHFPTTIIMAVKLKNTSASVWLVAL